MKVGDARLERKIGAEGESRARIGGALRLAVHSLTHLLCSLLLFIKYCHSSASPKSGGDLTLSHHLPICIYNTYVCIQVMTHHWTPGNCAGKCSKCKKPMRIFNGAAGQV